MSFTSYAQNFEDVMMWRALKHVRDGFYIDLGARHPTIDSVSKAFHEHGWKGILVEPKSCYVAQLKLDRTGSTVITDWAKASLPSGQSVHWLKIDSVSLADKFLESWDSRNLRPWIMVMDIRSCDNASVRKWNDLLTDAGYQFVYFDGLNNFYIAKEHPELLPAFSCPPNALDKVKLSGLATSEFCQAVLTQKGEALMQQRETESSLQKAKLKIEQLTAEVQEHKQAVQRLHKCGWALPHVVRHKLRPLAVIIMRRAITIPALKKLASQFLVRHPALRQRVYLFAVRAGVAGNVGYITEERPMSELEAAKNLSPRALQIYDLLKKPNMAAQN